MTVVVDGSPLTVDDVVAVAYRNATAVRVEISTRAWNLRVRLWSG